MFIERQSHWSPENNPERNWRSHEGTSATKDRRGKQQRSFRQTTRYIDPQKYYQNRKSPTSSSFIPCGR